MLEERRRVEHDEHDGCTKDTTMTCVADYSELHNFTRHVDFVSNCEQHETQVRSFVDFVSPWCPLCSRTSPKHPLENFLVKFQRDIFLLHFETISKKCPTFSKALFFSCRMAVFFKAKHSERSVPQRVRSASTPV